METKRKEKNLHWIWIFLAGVLMCFWCWYNGFPFAYSDTGTYIYSGFEGFIPLDRPLAYGLFIRHTSMKESLFWTALAQGLLTAVFVAWYIKSLGGIKSPFKYIGLTLLLISCTHLSIYASFLMPDFFTPIFYGCLVLLIVAPMGKGQQLWLVLIGGYAAMAHYAHLIAGALIAIVLTVAMLLSPIRLWLPWRKLALLWGFVAASWMGLLLLHYSFSGKWKIMQAGPVFTLARMNEYGLLKQYLNKACDEGKNYRICADKDSIPDDFLWAANSPSKKYGGWEANREEFTDIQKDILTTPKYLKRWLVQSVNGTLKQFFFFRTEDFFTFDEKAPARNAIKLHMPHELNAFNYSHQNGRRHFLDFEGTNTRQLYLFFACILISVLLTTSKTWRDMVPPLLVRAFFLVLFFLLLNAFLSSAFSTIVPRYQGRLLWLWILTGAMVFSYWWANAKKYTTTFISPKNTP